jgi:hypothetical protein
MVRITAINASRTERRHQISVGPYQNRQNIIKDLIEQCKIKTFTLDQFMKSVILGTNERPPKTELARSASYWSCNITGRKDLIAFSLLVLFFCFFVFFPFTNKSSQTFQKGFLFLQITSDYDIHTHNHSHRKYSKKGGWGWKRRWGNCVTGALVKSSMIPDFLLRTQINPIFLLRFSSNPSNPSYPYNPFFFFFFLKVWKSRPFPESLVRWWLPWDENNKDQQIEMKNDGVAPS